MANTRLQQLDTQKREIKNNLDTEVEFKRFAEKMSIVLSALMGSYKENY